MKQKAEIKENKPNLDIAYPSNNVDTLFSFKLKISYEKSQYNEKNIDNK